MIAARRPAVGANSLRPTEKRMSHSVDLTPFSASELDELIAKAAARRATLQPPPPLEAPKQAEAIVNPHWFTCLVEPGTLLQLRHPGLGWLSFVIGPNERAHLLGILLNQALVRPADKSAKPPPSLSGGTTVH